VVVASSHQTVHGRVRAAPSLGVASPETTPDQQSTLCCLWMACLPPLVELHVEDDCWADCALLTSPAPLSSSCLYSPPISPTRRNRTQVASLLADAVRKPRLKSVRMNCCRERSEELHRLHRAGGEISGFFSTTLVWSTVPSLTTTPVSLLIPSCVSLSS
jgi:hypothetical protein